jgi:hypothetical protein
MVNTIVDVCNVCDNRKCNRVSAQVTRDGDIELRERAPKNMPRGKCGQYAAPKRMPLKLWEVLDQVTIDRMYQLAGSRPSKRNLRRREKRG